MNELEKTIGYEFKNKELLETALTHSSFANELHGNVKYNERLEFLGDSVLGMVTAEYLFKTYPDRPEGQLTRMRANCVCERALAGFAKDINLGNYLRLGKGEINTGGMNRPSILADAFESLIAAIYLDAGFERVRDFILPFIEAVPAHGYETDDYKTVLQEIVQKNHDEVLEYYLVDETGPDHNKRFVYEVHINSNCIGTGEGRSKKQAEQAAAKEALRLMGVVK